MSKFNKVLTDAYHKAKLAGRLCTRCGWIITIAQWRQGKKLCEGCEDALKGVNVQYGYYPDSDEISDLTGEML